MHQLPYGHIFGVGRSFYSGEISIYRLENKTISGSGKFKTQGVPIGVIAQCIESSWAYFQDNVKKVIPGITLTDKDYLLYYADSQNNGRSDEISVAEFIALCSAVAEKPILDSLAVAGELKLSGTIEELTNLDDILRVSKNAGAKRILIPMDSIKDIQNIPRELLCDIQPIFYTDPIDAARKALSLI